MNNDLISRSALKKAIELFKSGHNIGTDYENGIIDGYDFCLDEIDNAPTVERPQGEWINPYLSSTTGEFSARCNICGEDIMTSSHRNFCPNCGADMRKPNCVTCNHFGDCDGCERSGEE